MVGPMRLTRLIVLPVLALATPALATPPVEKTAMTKPSSSPSPDARPFDLEAETSAWQHKRISNLTSEDGWLSLVGLFWLREGDNTFGSAPENDFVFPAGTPARIGTLTRHGTQVTVQAEHGVELTRDGKPFSGGAVGDSEKSADVLGLGSLRFYLIRRGEHLGLRVKDPHAPALRNFHPIATWPVNAAWRIEARFEPSPTPRKISIPTVLGTVEEADSPGTLVFQLNGEEHRLDPVLEPESNQLFIVFADQTNRTDSYGAGRFLSADMPQGGRVVLDFNRAYNPPCAFSPYATCPLPPPQNRLKLRVEAGEKRYGDH